jgi:transcriptional regulator with XRE-family HTH domain
MHDIQEQWRRVAADNIKRLRKARGLSQTKLGQLTGMDRAYLARFESKAVNISLDILLNIAAALEVTPAELLTPQGKRERKAS